MSIALATGIISSCYVEPPTLSISQKELEGECETLLFEGQYKGLAAISKCTFVNGDICYIYEADGGISCKFAEGIPVE
jgi:hypothetical protein